MNHSTPGLPVPHYFLEPPPPPNSCPWTQWCHPTISPSVAPFSSFLQSFPASGSFQMSQLFASCGQSIGVSASTSNPPVNTQDWSPLGWTGWISLQSKGLSRVFSNTTVQKHQFFGALLSNSHIQTWPLGKPYPWLDRFAFYRWFMYNPMTISLLCLTYFPDNSSVDKESSCNAGDPGSILGSGRSPGEGKGYPLQYPGLENSMDYTLHGVTKSWTQLSNVHLFPLGYFWRSSILQHVS